MPEELTDYRSRQLQAGATTFLMRRGGILVILACVVAIAVNTLSATFVVPRPFTDSVAFIPAAVAFRLNGALTNPIVDLTYAADPKHSNRFTFYPPLFPWLIGSLMLTETPRAAFAVVAVFRILTILGLAALILRAARNLSNEDSWVLLGVGSVLLLAEAGMRVPTVGRPEALASLFLVGAIATLLVKGQAWRIVTLSVTLGLIGATHPAGAAMSAVLILIYFSFTEPPRLALARAVSAVLGGVLICLILIAASPNGLVDTVRGTANHAYLEIPRGMETWWELIRYLFLWWDRFFFFPLYVLTLLAGAIALVVTGRRPKSASLFVASCLLMGLGIWFFGLRVPPATYNLSMFFPFSVIAIIWLCRLFLHQPEARWLGYSFAGVAALCGAISSLAIVKYGLEFAFMIHDRKFYQDAQTLVQTTISPDHGCVYYDDQLWVLYQHYDHLREAGSDWTNDSCADAGPPVLLSSGSSPFKHWQNRYHSFVREDVVFDWRGADYPRLFGVTISKFLPGYSFYILRGENVKRREDR